MAPESVWILRQFQCTNRRCCSSLALTAQTDGNVAEQPTTTMILSNGSKLTTVAMSSSESLRGARRRRPLILLVVQAATGIITTAAVQHLPAVEWIMTIVLLSNHGGIAIATTASITVIITAVAAATAVVANTSSRTAIRVCIDLFLHHPLITSIQRRLVLTPVTPLSLLMRCHHRRAGLLARLNFNLVPR